MSQIRQDLALVARADERVLTDGDIEAIAEATATRLAETVAMLERLSLASSALRARSRSKRIRAFGPEPRRIAPSSRPQHSRSSTRHISRRTSGCRSVFVYARMRRQA
jgi:hypothetical protein